MEKSRKGDFYHQTLSVIVLKAFKVQRIHLQHLFSGYHDKIARLVGCFLLLGCFFSPAATRQNPDLHHYQW